MYQNCRGCIKFLYPDQLINTNGYCGYCYERIQRNCIDVGSRVKLRVNPGSTLPRRLNGLWVVITEIGVHKKPNHPVYYCPIEGHKRALELNQVDDVVRSLPDIR